ncbi:hypothetical protein B0H10DRAFT_1946645 [Mycena sp. CBHHK59/15]|nr:hypothetical protein B0H10DRAFT_1946645 [Mycena sp. CBHHK59/15]
MSRPGHVVKAPFAHKKLEVGKKFVFEASINFRPVWSGYGCAAVVWVSHKVHDCGGGTSGRGLHFGTNIVVYGPDLLHKKVEAGKEVWVHTEYFLLAYVAQFGHFCTRHMIVAVGLVVEARVLAQI